MRNREEKIHSTKQLGRLGDVVSEKHMRIFFFWDFFCFFLFNILFFFPVRFFPVFLFVSCSMVASTNLGQPLITVWRFIYIHPFFCVCVLYFSVFSLILQFLYMQNYLNSVNCLQSVWYNFRVDILWSSCKQFLILSICRATKKHLYFLFWQNITF